MGQDHGRLAFPASIVNPKRGEAVPSEEPMPKELLDLVAERFRALAEPVRLQLLDALRRKECIAGELA